MLETFLLYKELTMFLVNTNVEGTIIRAMGNVKAADNPLEMMDILLQEGKR